MRGVKCVCSAVGFCDSHHRKDVNGSGEGLRLDLIYMQMVRDERFGVVIDSIWAVADERRPRRRNRKWMGDVAESAFLHKAVQLGLIVAKPWGDNSSYDFIVDSGERLLRVQVKMTSSLCDGRYKVAAHGAESAPYGLDDIDVLVAFVPPEDAWYIIPVEAFTPRAHLWVYPQGEHAGQYEKYRDAWDLLGATDTVLG
jgi:PD-(D/E)XK endonuclease